MELLQDETYRQVLTSYEKLVKNSLARNENYDMKKFIGGLPVTMEKQDMSTINTKKPNGKSEYTVTQKVDGTRMLMYIVTVPGVKNGRMVYFIDRNTNIYRVRNSSQDSLDPVDSREMLIDGEVVFFDRDNNSHPWLDISRTKAVSFMAFDILYAPNNIDVIDGERIIGQDSSMTVPEDGKLRTQPWPYINRYDILYKLIMPGKFNNEEPLLLMSFRNKNWFNVEIKPIYFIHNIMNKEKLYTPTENGELQKLLVKHRKDFYSMIKEKYQKTIDTYISKKITLDGLIFTSADTLYNIGPWNKPDTTQFKWKPNDEQTIDLMIVKTGRGTVVKFQDKTGTLRNWTKKSFDSFKDVTVDVPDYVQNNSIVEFQVISRNNFKFKNVRHDKNTPNSLRTILNVIRSVENPIDINDIYYFSKLGTGSTMEELKKVLSYSSRSSLLRCISTSNMTQILDPSDITNIQKQLNRIGSQDIEVEMRLGKINYRGDFNPNIDQDIYNRTVKEINNYKMKKSIEYYVDAYSDELPGIRTRHIYSNDFKKFILLDSIIKKRNNDINIDMSNLWEKDIRISTSTETRVTDYVTSGKYYLKQRTSYQDSSDSFRVDFTLISDGNFVDRNFIEYENANRKRQIEIEILKNNININEMFVFITNLIKS